ncbi:helix-turn-helix domain-containing protein [Peribacillus loiseleuriae]|uniref:helix-turn-helix domain-containing protein n=1 Tax=Peribacillus loiseleuriae TaxID=1679170 RepID=UPI003D03441D
MSEFGKYIKKIRDEKGLTLNQAAMYSDISAAQLSRIENGIRNVPKPKTIKKIADGMKIDYDELMRVAGYISEHDEPESKQNNKDEKDIAKRMEEIKKDLSSQDGLMFSGEPLSEEAVESLLEAMEHIIRQTQRINKKYIPKKYRENE